MKSKMYLYPMEVRCAWCGCHRTWKSCEKEGKISHGICAPCKNDAMKEIKAIRPTGTAKGA